MGHLIWLILLIAIKANAQNTLKFDTRLIDCEDKWVTLPINKDSTYTYGFVYLDNMAGLTFHLEGTYKFSNEGKIILKKQPITQLFKQRLSSSNIRVAVVPASMYNELEVQQLPDWLKVYKRDDGDISRMYMLGVTYNAWNEAEKGLAYLLKVEQINPKYKALNYELAFAYNALKQYDKAIFILQEALKTTPKNCELYKELIYAQMNLKQVDNAMESGKLALDVCTDKNFRAKLLRDLVYNYYSKKDKAQFKIWADKAKIEMATIPGALQGIAKWEAELNK